MERIKNLEILQLIQELGLVETGETALAYNAHYPLKVACLPFHHVRVLWDCKNMQYSVKRKIFQKN